MGYFKPWNGPAVDGEGFIYTEAAGRVKLNDYVASLGMDDLGITFALPLGISPNGKYIVGIGRTEDDLRGFVIKLPAPLSTANVNASKVAIYPNPVGDILHVTNADKISTIEIFNMAGQKMSIDTKVSKEGLNVSALAKGAYIVTVKTGTDTQRLKMLKK